MLGHRLLCGIWFDKGFDEWTKQTSPGGGLGFKEMPRRKRRPELMALIVFCVDWTLVFFVALSEQPVFGRNNIDLPVSKWAKTQTSDLFVEQPVISYGPGSKKINRDMVML